MDVWTLIKRTVRIERASSSFAANVSDAGASSGCPPRCGKVIKVRSEKSDVSRVAKPVVIEHVAVFGRVGILADIPSSCRNVHAAFAVPIPTPIKMHGIVQMSVRTAAKLIFLTWHVGRFKTAACCDRAFVTEYTCKFLVAFPLRFCGCRILPVCMHTC